MTFLTRLFVLTACLVALGAVAFIVHALVNVPPPEERCFNNAIGGEPYCRTQARWESS